MYNSAEPALPFDVIGNIIDILIGNNAKGLKDVKAFSLTCQSALPFCRKHIFSSILIEIGSASCIGLEELGQLLLETPEIAKFIRQLNICILEPYIRYSISQYSSDQVPAQLTRLRSLKISCHAIANWEKMSLSMKRPLLNLMCLPTLDHLHLELLRHFPISNLTTCPDIKHLYVDAFIGRHPDLPSRKPIQLHTFELKLWDRPTALDLL